VSKGKILGVIKKALIGHWIVLAVLPVLVYLLTLIAIAIILILQAVSIYKTYRDINVSDIHVSEIRDLSKTFLDLEAQTNALNKSYDRFTYLMFPFMHYSIIAQEVGSLDDFFTDVESLLIWSGEVLVVAEDMDSLQTDIRTVLDSNIDFSDDISTYTARLEKATSRLETLSESMNVPSHTSGYGLIVNLFMLESKLSQIKVVLKENVDVVLSSSKVIVNTFELVNRGELLYNQLRFDFTRGDSVWDLEEVRSDLNDIHYRAMTALGALHELNRYDGNLNPVSTHMDELYTFLSTTLTLCDSVKSGLEIIGPLTRTSTSNKFLQDGSLVDIFTALNESHYNFLLLQSNVNRLDGELNRLSEFDLFMNRQDLTLIKEIIPDIMMAIDFGIAASKNGREFVGIGGEKKYLILGHSSDEIRGTGGFVSAIWLMVWNNGRLLDLQYYDTVEVDDIDRISLYPEAPEDLRKHMNAWAWLMRDISWDPDFPTTAKNAMHVFNLGQGLRVDGVIGINQWSLNNLVEAVGEISIEGNDHPVSSRNLLSLLEEGTDQEGRQFTDKIMKAFISELQSSKQISRLFDIGLSFKDSLDAKDILINHNSDNIQQTIEDFGWSGSINGDKNDFIYVVDSNIGWTKSDRNVERKMHYEIDLSDQPITSNLRIYYYNHSAPSAAPCEPQWINRGKSYFDLKNACYWDYIRIYVPDSARMIHGTPMPLPKMSVAVETGYEEPGFDTISVYEQHARSVFSGVFTIEHGRDISLEFIYELPRSLIEATEGLNKYSLLVQKQPGIQRRVSSFTIKLPKFSTIISAVPKPDFQSAQVIQFSDFLEKDFELKIEYRD